jgi:Ti-type conjugative transfer relaxase TraA
VAIQFARARYISRSSGGCAVRSAAYNAREAIEAERTGELFYFKHREAPEHHEVLLPEGAAQAFRDCGVLWNAAEAAEKRKDAQVAREIVLALPANTELTDEDRVALARSFAMTHFVSKGLAVQLDVHRPHEAPAEGQPENAPTNWHAHLLISTRRLEGERFAAKKARDLDPEMRRAAGKSFVTDGDAWGELWRDHQDRYFQEHGLTIRVDSIVAFPGQHIGPVRMRRADSEAVERAAVLRQANEAAARDPAQVLAVLTRNNATFTERELDRYLARHIEPEDARAVAKAAVLGHGELLALHDRATGEVVERWTTRTVRAQELSTLADGAVLAGGHAAVPADHAAAALASRRLRDDQRGAFEHAVAAGGLKLIEGRAGTGKSFTLQAVREAHERAGLRVVGLAPTNVVAQDLKAEGFAEAGTAHAELFRLKNGRATWDGRTVVIVDEAAMMDSRVTGELLAAARVSGAKVILAGDDRQLASIERGGLFTELKARHGAAEIVQVTRQKVDWQRDAARDLAEGRFADAVAAFDHNGGIVWTADQEEARAALVAAWKRDAAERPGSSRFVFAYTNQDVDAFNAELRAVCRERGELTGADVVFETRHGPLAFAVGDRVQFTDTLKAARLYNGNVGTITGIDATTGQLRAVLDISAGGEGREVTWSPADFQGFRHGYAGTIYKGQGKTLDHTYLYHTHHWRSAASYVALTRQRESAQVFVATDTARDAAQLARQMARGEVKAASVAWATGEEIATGALVSRVAALRALVSRLQARTAERLQRHAERAEARRAAGGPVASLSRRIGHRRTMEMLHQVLGVSARLVEQGADSIARTADAVAALPQALQAMADRRAAQARQAEQERAARQQEIAAGVSRFRDRYADRRRQEAEAARDDLARRAVATWEDLIRAHHAALPGIATDPGLKGTREQLIQFARALDRTPEVAHALRTRGPEFGMETRPNLARVLDGASAERAVVVLLDGVEERQRAALKAEAEQKAALEARMRPRSSPSMGW